MELCSYNHDEVCFEGRTCPVCDAVSNSDREQESLAETIASLRVEIESLKDELRNVENT